MSSVYSRLLSRAVHFRVYDGLASACKKYFLNADWGTVGCIMCKNDDEAFILDRLCYTIHAPKMIKKIGWRIARRWGSSNFTRQSSPPSASEKLWLRDTTALSTFFAQGKFSSLWVLIVHHISNWSPLCFVLVFARYFTSLSLGYMLGQLSRHKGIVTAMSLNLSSCQRHVLCAHAA